jgi:hypothetical protein
MSKNYAGETIGQLVGVTAGVKRKYARGETKAERLHPVEGFTCYNCRTDKCGHCNSLKCSCTHRVGKPPTTVV